MTLSVFAVEAQGLPDVLRCGPMHPAVGAFLDIGSYGRVACGSAGWGTAGAGPATSVFDYLLGSELDAAARAAGVRLVRLPDGDGGGHPGSSAGIGAADIAERHDGAAIVVAGLSRLGTGSPGDDAWHDALARGDAVALVIVDEAEAVDPVWVLAGHGLPAMGPVGPCGRDDLWSTWLAVTGGRVAQGRFLLEERELSIAPDGERGLTTRLRELYGE